jgi:hypothetical protein
MKRPRREQVLKAAVTFSTAVVLSSCGKAPSASTQSLATLSPTMSLERAIKDTESAPSFEVYLKISGQSTTNERATVIFSGVYGTSFGQHEARVLSSYTSPQSASPLESNVRSISTYVYVDPLSKRSQLPKGKIWIESRSMEMLASLTSNFWILFTNGGTFDPTSILGDLQDPTTVQRSGVTVLGGVTQNIYTATFGKWNPNSSYLPPEKNVKVLAEVGPNSYISELYVPKLEVEVTPGQIELINFKLDLFSYGIPVSVSVPPPQSVTTSQS